MSRSYHHGDHTAERQRPFRGLTNKQTFRCRRCKAMVGPPPSGGRQRNHCPRCLYSRHVDDRTPGDRASDCGALMAPIGVYTRRNGEYVVVHRCLGCGTVRYNRVAADDIFDLVLTLPYLAV